MKFKILSVKDNSVRVKSGIVTFNVIVTDIDGRLSIKADAWIENDEDFRLLSGAVKGEYNRYKSSLVGDISSNEQTQVYNRK